jgi:hypothetical protein
MRFPRLLGLLSLALLLVACGDTSASDTPPAPTTRSASQATSAPLVPQPTALPPTSLPNPTAAPAAPAATSVPAAPAAPSGDPKAAVLAAFKAQLTSGPFRSVTTLLSEGKTTELTAEFVPPSSLHLVVAGEGTQNETVIIGEKMWSKAGEEWTAMPGGGPQVTAMLAEFTQDPESRGVVISNVQYLGLDMVDGTPTWVYSTATTPVSAKATMPCSRRPSSGWA